MVVLSAPSSNKSSLLLNRNRYFSHTFTFQAVLNLNLTTQITIITLGIETSECYKFTVRLAEKEVQEKLSTVVTNTSTHPST